MTPLGQPEITGSTTTAQLYFSGLFLGGIKALVRCRLAMTSDGVVLEMKARSGQRHVSQAIIDLVA